MDPNNSGQGPVNNLPLILESIQNRLETMSQTLGYVLKTTSTLTPQQRQEIIAGLQEVRRDIDTSLAIENNMNNHQQGGSKQPHN